MYNVPLRRVLATIVADKSNNYYTTRTCICSLRYRACNARAPYFIVICGLSGCTIYFHIIS